MLKKSLIITSIFLFLSILVTGSPFKVDISYNENDPFFSLDNVNQFAYAQNGSDESSDSGSDESSDSGSDKSEFASNDENKENSEKNSPDFLSSPEGGRTVDLPLGEDNPPPLGEDNPPPVGEDNPPPVGEDNPEPSKEENNIKDKINLEFKKITKIISKTKTKVIVKDDSDSEKEIIIVSDPTCPTQSETIELNGMIDPKGIRLLAKFYPCI